MQVEMDYNSDLIASGTCFDDPYEMLAKGYITPEASKEVVIVHGLVSRRKGAQDVYSHCWVEFKGRFVEMAFIAKNNEKIILEFTPKQFRKLYKIHDQTRYKFVDLLIAAAQKPELKSGPYLQKYIEKCKDYHFAKFAEELN